MDPVPHLPAGPRLEFTGRRVLIAGGSKGIGRAMALAFASAGARVSVCARGEAGLAALREDAGALGLAVHTVSADLSRLDDIGRWLADAAQALGGIDVLVNNATGYGMADDEAGWEASLNVDLMSAVRASRLALPWLQQSSDACILNMASIAAQQPRPGGAPYAAAKAALMLQEWDDLVEAIERAEARRKALMEEFVLMAGNGNAEICGRKLTLVERAGAISYAKAVKELAPDADLEKWRGNPVQYWKLG